MRVIPLLKYKAAERLRFGGSLSRSGPEIEPHGGYSRWGPIPPWPIRIRAPVLRQDVRVVVRIAFGGWFAPNPPLTGPTLSPAALVWPLLGGKRSLLLPRIRSDTCARWFTIPLGLSSLRLGFPPRGCGVGSVHRSLPGPPGLLAAEEGAACSPWCVWCDPGSPGGLGHPGHPGCTRGSRRASGLASLAWCNPGSPGG